MSRNAQSNPLVSVVLPCLNEKRTVATCVRKARKSLSDANFSFEVVVSDNGSTDGSQEEAKAAGARVVHCPHKGYGAAIQYGVEQSNGECIVMADADDSYDLTDLRTFVSPLLAGSDMVMGNRFRGGIAKGAMPWKNRYIGNPGLTGTLNLLYGTRIGDAHCGLRSFTRRAYDRMSPQSPGMEFASELVVRAAQMQLDVTEVATTLSPDGRDRPPHLSPWRDGWRHLRFLLVNAPSHVFAFTGLLLCLFGLLALLISPAQWQTLLPASGAFMTVIGTVSVLTGGTTLLLGLASRTLLANRHGLPLDACSSWFRKVWTLDRGVFGGLGLTGLGCIAWLVSLSGAFSPTGQFTPLTTAIIVLGIHLVAMSLLIDALLSSTSTRKPSFIKQG